MALTLLCPLFDDVEAFFKNTAIFLQGHVTLITLRLIAFRVDVVMPDAVPRYCSLRGLPGQKDLGKIKLLKTSKEIMKRPS